MTIIKDIIKEGQDAQMPMAIQQLKHRVSQFEDVRDTLAKLKQRIAGFGGDENFAVGDMGYMEQVEKARESLEKLIDSQMKEFPIWNEWLKNVPGVGPSLGGQFITRFEYKFNIIPEPCPHCDGEGCGRCKDTGQKKTWPPKYDIQPRDWRYCSSVWHFAGVHVIEEICPACEGNGCPQCNSTGKVGRAPRTSDLATDGAERKEGKGYNPAVRTLCYLIGVQFVKQGKKYRELYDQFKPEIQRKHPDDGACEACKKNRLSHKKHIEAMVRRKVVKIFLQHYYVVHKTLKGLPATKPWPQAVAGHGNYIAPFYFDGKVEYSQ